MSVIKNVCSCGSYNVSVISVGTGIITFNDKNYPAIEISYKCNKCNAIQVNKYQVIEKQDK